MNPNEYKVVQLKEMLQKRQLQTYGSKAELIARLQEADPEGDWLHEIGNAEETLLKTSPDRIPRDRHDVPENALRELEYMRRKRELMERETRLLERENQILRSGGVPHSSTNSSTETPSRVNINAVSELLNEFNGSDGLFRNWEKQSRLLISTYQLNEKYVKIMLEMLGLKDKALEFHSCPEHIELSVDELLSKMRWMYVHKESKLKLRKQFEERMWKPEETFSAYYHKKIILPNRVPIDEEEILEYLVEDISNVQLQNQAKLQKFKSMFDLLTAFKTIN